MFRIPFHTFKNKHSLHGRSVIHKSQYFTTTKNVDSLSWKKALLISSPAAFLLMPNDSEFKSISKHNEVKMNDSVQLIHEVSKTTNKDFPILRTSFNPKSVTYNRTHIIKLNSIQLSGRHFSTSDHQENSKSDKDKEKGKEKESSKKRWEKIKSKGSYLRVWTIDKAVAFTSWFVVGTTTWVLIGTTTLISVILWLVNQFDEDGRIAAMVGNYLTQSSGLQIKYEQAAGTSIFKEGRIKLKNVTIYRPPPEEHENHGLLDLTIDEVEIKLSMLWMLEGRGVVKEMVLRGMRGIYDRRTEKPDPTWKPVRRTWQRGDFEFTKLTVEDALITMHMPYSDARPLSLTIYSMEAAPFRKQWLLNDIFCAKSIVGIFDGCLFKYGPPQRKYLSNEPKIEKERVLKIDGNNMDLLSKNASGPLGWMKEGTFDINMRVVIPTVPPQSFYNLFQEDSELTKKIQMHCNIRLNHILLEPPLYNPELSYMNNALIQPISRYMNAHAKHVGLSFEMFIPEEYFDGAWTPAQAHIWDALSEAVYHSLSAAVEEQRRKTDFKKLMEYAWKFFFG